MNQLTFSVIPFKDLSSIALYNILFMREQVFALEQNCLYQDIDGLDVAAFHVLGYDEQNELVAYCRLLPPGKPYEGYYSIGRVLTTKNGRGKGYGQLLMAEAMKILKEEDSEMPIKIGAQYYLKKFYASFGFIQTGEIYDEDGIDHIHMIFNYKS